MDTRHGLGDELLHAVASRPAMPGLVLVAGLLALAGAGQEVIPADWFWPACTVIVVLAVLINAARQDFWRRVARHDHQQRMSTATAILHDQPAVALAATGPAEITGSIRDLGGLVERFGNKLDDLLAEVHAENTAADQRQRHA